MSRFTRSPAAALLIALGLSTAACTAGPAIADETKASLMENCSPDYGEDFCECVLEEFEEADLTDAKIIELAEEMDSDPEEIPDEFLDAGEACADLLPVLPEDPGD
jgi:hypothetical protein